jgi:alpha-ketoglutarate-dependent taurine dioxygenase
VSPAELVETGPVLPDRSLPLAVQARVPGLELAAWAAANREAGEAGLLQHGAVLFRGFRVESAQDFRALVQVFAPDLLDYRERAAPRSEVGDRIYTSTEYPPEEYIPLHHEMSYSHNWPARIWFYCERPAAAGGHTPVACDREVFRRLDPELKRPFLEKRVMYVRNYGEGLDLTWQEAFQTGDRSTVERYCRDSGIAWEWRPGNRLRTRQVRQAVVVHPRTGDTVWFNHAHMFHVSNLPPEVREALLRDFAEDELPRNAFYGDGTPIGSETLEEIRRTYRDAAASFPWQRGDVLMVDNILASHGRDPFVGPRSVLVAMADLLTNPD